MARTNLCALACLIRFSDNKVGLFRWSLLLAEFEFDTEYRPGSAIQHVAALSRHVAAMSEDPPKAYVYKAAANEKFFVRK